ncbi:MAG: phosphonate ABC transporter, permease protein PhnE, partial [Clostridiales bacterium]|nr:phosphonate ABC transporter, permease protein PhnE [Clostridiales bacterium]
VNYLSDIMPSLHLANLFAGSHVKGSLAWWGYRLPIQLPLVLETLQMALASTLIAVIFAIPCAFLIANNVGAAFPIRFVLRTIAAFLRTMPDLVWAVIFVMAFGIGPFSGFLAMLLHSTGSLTKLFYDAVESTQNRTMSGLIACGASSFQQVRFALWSQVKPVIVSLSLMCLEINFRSSAILGLVGAGGIGQELMTNIKLDRYDQVSMTLLLIVIVVSILDSLSGFLRKKVLHGHPILLKAGQRKPSRDALRRFTWRPLIHVGLWVSIVILYYFWFFSRYGISGEQLNTGIRQIGFYLQRMFIWQNIAQWPLYYYLKQIFITLAIVFTGTFSATVIALPLSFLAARNTMQGGLAATTAILMRRLFDLLRGIDMTIWGLIFVRAIGLGPLAGVLAIIMQDTGLLGRLFTESHEAVERSPVKGLTAVGASALQKHRFGIFTQSFPTFLALSLYQIESNTRSAAVLGFVGAGGVGLIYAENMRLWNWDVVMFITLMMVTVVMIIDTLSAWLRRRFIDGHIIPQFIVK